MSAESQSGDEQPGERRRRRLSHFSSVFLRTGADPSLSSRCKPWVVMAKLFFEEEIDPDKLWNLFCYKLSEFPRFRSVAVFSGRHVYMEEVPVDLDRDYHLRTQASKGWTDDEINEYMITLRSHPMDLSRPLWRLHVLNSIAQQPENDQNLAETQQNQAGNQQNVAGNQQNLAGNQQNQAGNEQKEEEEESGAKRASAVQKSAAPPTPTNENQEQTKTLHCLLIEVDHSIGDGITFLATLLSLSSLAGAQLDPSALPRPRPMPALGWVASARWATEGVLSWIQHQILKDSDSALKKHSFQDLSQRQVTSDSAPVALSLVKEIAARIAGSSVNVILSSAMALAIHAYLTEAGQRKVIERGTLRAQFMITMRGKGGGAGGAGGKREGGGMLESLLDGDVGSKTTTDTFALPFASSRLDMVHSIQYQSFRSRLSPSPWIQMWFLGLLEPLPSWVLLRLYLFFMSKFTVISSNIAGPQHPCLILDLPVRSIRYYAFLPHGLYWGFMSYNGHVTASVVADAAVVEKPRRLMQLFNEELQQLHKEATQHQNDAVSEPLPKFGLAGPSSLFAGPSSWFQIAMWSIGGLILAPVVVRRCLRLRVPN